MLGLKITAFPWIYWYNPIKTILKNILNWPKQSQLILFYSVTSSRIYLPQIDEYFRLCTVVFDEVKVTNVAKIDKKIDMLLGPGKQVSSNTVVIR